MTTALLSIHPEHVAALLAGRKRVELRRVVPKRDVRRLVIYETAPAKRVVAEADVRLVVASPAGLWREFGSGCGAGRAVVLRYFAGRHRVCGLEILRLQRPASQDLRAYGVRAAPQSLAYVDADLPD